MVSRIPVHKPRIASVLAWTQILTGYFKKNTCKFVNFANKIIRMQSRLNMEPTLLDGNDSEQESGKN
jgi:hypothetical protein